ncbi:DUF3325 domain-containing protein [Novosphingobium guangzhouense]|uniref:DUF3325 domain-containing protein n=1 Tax=Novosphingobium guangzhouense TaxID=1850347 RepID=A0A2K2FXA5_9SPHN|nr:DUF3325 domain-containing protein [Novosphingobium guangzhouense]PNU03427.1 hypothetical protein A8V01_06880 [Novosphingobium guangzhouense]
MIHVLALALSFAAFLSLAVAMKRHQRDLTGRTLTDEQARAARTSGWLLLAGALGVNIAALGSAMGTIVWFGEASVGAGLTVTAINWAVNRKAGRGAR